MEKLMSAVKFMTFDPATGSNMFAAPATVGGSGSAYNLVALDGDGRLHSAMLPAGTGVSVVVHRASGALSAGDLVNIYLDIVDDGIEGDTGWRVRRADASDPTKYAVGFVVSAYTSGALADVYLEGQFPLTSTLNEVYLTESPGIAGSFDAEAAFRQLVGRRIGANNYEFIQGERVLLN
jgi:hypothetical protein